MSRLLLISLLVFMFSIAQGQEYFSKIISSPDTARIGRDMTRLDSDLFVHVQTNCEPNAQSCNHLLKINSDGELVSRFINPFRRVANTNSVHVVEQRIMTSSRETMADGSTSYYQSAFTAEGDLDYESESVISENVMGYLYGSLPLSNGTFLQYGVIDLPAQEAGLVFNYSDLDGNLMKQDIRPTGMRLYNIWDVRELPSGSLIFLAEKLPYDENSNLRSYDIEKMDQSGQITTLYSTGLIKDHIGNALEMEYQNGRILFTVPWQENRAYFDYHCIDTLGNLLWNHVYGDAVYPDFFSIREISSYENGDFLIVGRLTLNEPALSYRYGAMYRVSSDGQLLWYKYFNTDDPDTGAYRESSLSVMKEDEQGNLIGTGYVRNTYTEGEPPIHDTWVLRVDADGCFGPDDCATTIVVTDVEEVKSTRSNVLLYPSIVGAGEPIRMRFEEHSSATYHIYDSQGTMVSMGVARSEEQIATPDRAGMYFITIPKLAFVGKFVVVR